MDNMMRSASDITIDNEFFKAFGSGSTNKRLGDGQNVGRPLHDRSMDGIKTESGSLYSVDSPSANGSPFQERYTSATSPGIPGWINGVNPQHPISPVDSATTLPKDWPFSYHNNANHHPGSIFTNLRSERSFRTQYGQVTPPDDEDVSFDRQLQERQELQERGSRKSRQSKEGKRSSSSASGEVQKSSTPPKRTRKYTSRNSKQTPPDPNNPGEVRRSKFLERNRVAASKCRQKKKEWTQNLEGRARDLQKNNNNLHAMIDSLSQEVFYLKTQCSQHTACDCSEIQSFMKDPAHDLSKQQPWLRQKARESFDHDSRASSYDTNGSSPNITAKDKEIANDDKRLEALLTSSMNHDTSDEGIAKRVGS